MASVEKTLTFPFNCCCLATKSCLTLCNPMDYSPPGFSVYGIPRQEYWIGLPFAFPGDISNPGIEPRSPALAGGFLTAEPPGKPPVSLVQLCLLSFLWLISLSLRLFTLKFILSDVNILSYSSYFPLCACAQLCPTLCNPMDCSPSCCSVRGIFHAKNIGVSCHFLLRGIYPTQGLTCLSCISYIGRWILYCWATKEALYYLILIFWAFLIVFPLYYFSILWLRW